MENKLKGYSILIKIGVGILMAIFIIILLCQYVSMSGLESKKNSIKADYEIAAAQNEELSKQKHDIESNYEDYVSDYVKEKYDYVKENEVLIEINE